MKKIICLLLSYDESVALSIDGQGNVYVTGHSLGPFNYYEYATVKYNSNGIQQWVQRYDGGANGNDDFLGREIAVLVNEKLKPGAYEVLWNTSSDGKMSPASGLYFYKLTAGKFVETRKMIMIK